MTDSNVAGSRPMSRAPAEPRFDRRGPVRSAQQDVQARAGGSSLPAHRHLVAVAATWFIVPNVLLANGMSPTPAGVLLIASALAIMFVWSPWSAEHGDFIDAPIRWPLLAASIVAVGAISILGGGLHFFYAQDDWLVRDSVLGDLSREAFPIAYRYNSVDYLLRAPLGMYLAPALVGRVAGVFAAHVALLVQNSFLLGSAAYVFAALAPRRAGVALVLFLAFSGLDLVAQLKMLAQGNGEPLWPPRSLQWWTLYFQYSSVVTQILWAPNHAAPGWWLGALALLAARREYDIARIGVLIAPMAFWSPLAVVAAPPFLLALALRDRFQVFREPQLWVGLTIACLFAPMLAYITVASGSVQSGFLPRAPGFWPMYALFLSLAVTQLYVVFKLRDRLDSRLACVFLPAFAMLFVLPLFLYGPGNDLVMRGSIPSLALLAFAFNSLIVDLDWNSRRGLGAVACVMIALGLATPASEIARSLYYPAFAISDCDVISAWYDLDHSGLPTNYVARVDRVPPWMFDATVAASPHPFVDRACWPDHPLPKEIHSQPR